MGERRTSRECALQLLFQMDLTGEDVEISIPKFWQLKDNISEQIREFCDSLVQDGTRRIAVLRQGFVVHAALDALGLTKSLSNNLAPIPFLLSEHLPVEGTPKALMRVSHDVRPSDWDLIVREPLYHLGNLAC